MRYIVAGLGFLLVWLIVAVVVGFAMLLLFPPKTQLVTVGIGLDWRNCPGTFLGLLAGIHSWRASLRAARKKDEKKKEP